MKVIEKSLTPKASRYFTDRKQPLEVFWGKYNIYQERMEKDAPDIDVSVLMYYGMDGIGKSALIAEIISEMKEKLAAPNLRTMTLIPNKIREVYWRESVIFSSMIMSILSLFLI